MSVPGMELASDTALSNTCIIPKLFQKGRNLFQIQLNCNSIWGKSHISRIEHTAPLAAKLTPPLAGLKKNSNWLEPGFRVRACISIGHASIAIIHASFVNICILNEFHMWRPAGMCNMAKTLIFANFEDIYMDYILARQNFRLAWKCWASLSRLI